MGSLNFPLRVPCAPGSAPSVVEPAPFCIDIQNTTDVAKSFAISSISRHLKDPADRLSFLASHTWHPTPLLPVLPGPLCACPHPIPTGELTHSRAFAVPEDEQCAPLLPLTVLSTAYVIGEKDIYSRRQIRIFFKMLGVLTGIELFLMSVFKSNRNSKWKHATCKLRTEHATDA